MAQSLIDHLLTLLQEEASEVIQRSSKAVRFGLADVQLGQPLDNEARLVSEIVDFLTIIDMIEESGFVHMPLAEKMAKMMEAKRQKVYAYMNLSRQLGKLE